MTLLLAWRLTSAGFLGLGAVALALVLAASLRSWRAAAEDRAPIDRVVPFVLGALAAIPLAVGVRELLSAPLAVYARTPSPAAVPLATVRLIAWGAGAFAAAAALSIVVSDGKRSYRVVVALVTALVALIFARASLPGL